MDTEETRNQIDDGLTNGSIEHITYNKKYVNYKINNSNTIKCQKKEIIGMQATEVDSNWSSSSSNPSEW